MKGVGAGYGLDEISQIGIEIEISAERGDDQAIRQAMEQLAHYLEEIEVVYE